MRIAILAVILSLPARAFAQTPPTESQRRLIGCFGEAFTLVEHVWRLAPKHLAALQAQAGDAGGEARKAFLDGFTSSAVLVDQDAAFAVVGNLDACLTAATAGTRADQTTAILATAVRTELDSALEDVGNYIADVQQQRDALRAALRTRVADARGSAFDSYERFGEKMRDQLAALRRKVDAVVTASTP